MAAVSPVGDSALESVSVTFAIDCVKDLECSTLSKWITCLGMRFISLVLRADLVF